MFPWAYYGFGGNFGVGWWLLMFLGMLIPLAVVVLVVWLVVRAFRTGPNSREEDPLNVLKVRYAKGEITREEYERIKEELQT